MRAANSITDQFEEARINDSFGRKFVPITGPLICQDQCSTIGIFVCTVTDVARVDTDVMPGQPRNHSPLRCDRPTFDMRFKEISIIADEFGCALVASVGEKLGAAYQRCNMDCKCRWRIAARFLPPLLRGDWTFPDEKPASATNHTIRIEVSQRTEFPESPRQKDWKCDFIQLYARPIRPPVDPEILVKTAVLALRHSEINERAQWRTEVTNFQQRGHAFDHVACPH